MEKVKITMVDYMYGVSLHEAVKKASEVSGGRLDFHFYDPRNVEAERVKKPSSMILSTLI